MAALQKKAEEKTKPQTTVRRNEAVGRLNDLRKGSAKLVRRSRSIRV